MTSPRDLEARVVTLRRDTAAPLSLLGDNDDRPRSWEVVKGITTAAEFRLVDRHRDARAARARAIGWTAKEMAVRAD